MTLGDFITELEMLHSSSLPVLVSKKWNISPTKLNSYRGYYDQLALGYALDDHCTVADLIITCKAAIRTAFEGYKGGNYLMSEYTELWLDNVGHVSSRRITGLLYKDRGYLLILTKKEP